MEFIILCPPHTVLLYMLFLTSDSKKQGAYINGYIGNCVKRAEGWFSGSV